MPAVTLKLFFAEMNLFHGFHVSRSSNTSCNRGNDAHFVVRLKSRVFTLKRVDVFVADVHANEAPQASSILKQVGFEAGMLRGEGREEVFHGGSFFGEDALAVGEFAQRRRDDQLSHVRNVLMLSFLYTGQEMRQLSGSATMVSSANCRFSSNCQLLT